MADNYLRPQFIQPCRSRNILIEDPQCHGNAARPNTIENVEGMHAEDVRINGKTFAFPDRFSKYMRLSGASFLRRGKRG